VCRRKEYRIRIFHIHQKQSLSRSGSPGFATVFLFYNSPEALNGKLSTPHFNQCATMARTIFRKKRSARIVNTQVASSSRVHSAWVIWQIFVFTSVCNLLKLVKSVYSKSTFAAHSYVHNPTDCKPCSDIAG